MMIPRLAALALALPLLATQGLVAQAFDGPAVRGEVRLLDGSSSRQDLVALTDEDLVLANGQSVPRKDLLRVGFSATPEFPEDALRVMLVDGSEIAASQYTSDGRTVSITTTTDQSIEVPGGRVRQVLFRQLNDDTAAQWRRIRERNHPSDVLVLDREGQLEALQGALGEITEERVHFTVTDVGAVRARRERLVGFLVVQPREVRLPEPVCEVVETDGSRWQASSVAIQDGQLAFNTAFVKDVTRPLERIGHLDFARGRIAYLTDLEPINLQVRTFFPHTFLVDERTGYEPRLNRNHLGEPLAIGGRTFSNGLALRGGTEMAYALRGGYTRFQAVVGIDAAVARHGTGDVEVMITGDNRRLLTLPLSHTDAPKTIELDVSGVERLFVRIGWGKHRLDGDYVNLCEAKLIK